MKPRCPKCGSRPAYAQGTEYCCMMCGKRWPINGAASIQITKIKGGINMVASIKTPSGKKGPCSNCGNVRFIADRDGHCSTCSRAIKGLPVNAPQYTAALAVAKARVTDPNRKRTAKLEKAMNKIKVKGRARMAAKRATSSTTPDRGKTEAIETLHTNTSTRLPAGFFSAASGLNTPPATARKSTLDMTVKQVAETGISAIIVRAVAERDLHLAEAAKLDKAIVILESCL